MKNIDVEKNRASGFRRKLLCWYDGNRRDLPWRYETDPYRIWLSEVMLQQTRVETVIPYYHRFLAAYPDLAALSAAEVDEVLKLWEGLGYYSRARNFLQAVREVRESYGGCVPTEPLQFGSLKGVGDYTRNAVCSIAFGEKLAVVDGNVVRVYSRLFAIQSDPAKAAVKKQIQGIAQTMLDANRPGDFNQAVMELGAMICIPRAPRCEQCPVADDCTALAEGIAAELPVKAPKKTVPRISLAAVVLIRDGKCLVQQRENQGLLAGLWEFPNVVLQREGDDPGSLLGELLGAKLRLGKQIMELSQPFSHLHWDVRVYRAEIGEDEENRLCGLWANPAELDRLAFPAVYHTLVRQVLDELKK